MWSLSQALVQMFLGCGLRGFDSKALDAILVACTVGYPCSKATLQTSEKGKVPQRHRSVVAWLRAQGQDAR